MSVGPQLQLAVLWPWLLMATLQIRLGYSGLALVAAERASAQKAVIRVVPLKMDPLMLEGVFASVAEVTPAEGKLLQIMMETEEEGCSMEPPTGPATRSPVGTSSP